MTLAAAPSRAQLWLASLVALLVAGTLMPSQLKLAVEQQLWAQLPWASMAHFVLFGAIAFVARCHQRRAPARVLAAALMLALLTELLQHWVPGRHPLLRDVLIDMAGCISGLLVAWLMGQARAA